jgi:HSP20 family molecular chaperone IbpA
MESTTLERPETERETPEDEPATPEPDGPNRPQDEPGEPESAAPGEELYMEGDEGYLTTDVGGKKPTDSKLQIVGRSVEIEGQVKKGGRIRAIVELEVGAVKFQDKKDGQTGQVVASTRTHYASIVGFAKQ